jgi:hypothetical protein
VGKVTYYGERIESEIYGSAVLIYKRKDVGGNNWWYRLKIDGVAGSCGARVGELKQLKWSDIRYERIDGEEVIYVDIRAGTSKVRTARTAVAHDATSTGKVLDKWRRVTEFDKKNDLIFYSAHYAKDGQREVELGNAFKNYLKSVEYEGREEGLYRDKDGNARTLYCLTQRTHCYTYSQHYKHLYNMIDT